MNTFSVPVSLGKYTVVIYMPAYDVYLSAGMIKEKDIRNAQPHVLEPMRYKELHKNLIQKAETMTGERCVLRTADAVGNSCYKMTGKGIEKRLYFGDKTPIDCFTDAIGGIKKMAFNGDIFEEQPQTSTVTTQFCDELKTYSIDIELSSYHYEDESERNFDLSILKVIHPMYSYYNC